MPSAMPSAKVCKVLVADDNRDNANILRQYLSGVWGYDVIVAYDGEEALKLYESERPSIVLLDVMMPLRDGWEVCEQIKNDNWAKANVRVIMVTALDDIANKRQALLIGADDFIEKPFDLARLAETVNRNVAALAQPA